MSIVLEYLLLSFLTGQKPIRSTDSEEDKSLVEYFLEAMKENRLFDVLDAGVLKASIGASIMQHNCDDIDFVAGHSTGLSKIGSSSAGIHFLGGASGNFGFSSTICVKLEMEIGDVFSFSCWYDGMESVIAITPIKWFFPFGSQVLRTVLVVVLQGQFTD
ncbi:hypothetical protein WN944_024740 [Citrus x changshan-huyou]|uniref:Uncharacterized protein n=1 Tax=Citrus x changshan-huyou TaxID=2935761 RepID=A0AAP0LP43_9ROSI